MKHIGRALVALAAAIGMAVSGGVATANAAYVPDDAYMDGYYDVSNVQVTNVGSDTATVKFDWKIFSSELLYDPNTNGAVEATAPLDPAKIKSVCAVADISRVTDITPIDNDTSTIWGSTIAKWPMDYKCGTSEQDHSVHEFNLNLPKGHEDNSDTFLAAKYTGQYFWQADNGEQWDGKSNSGTFSVKLTGLTPDTKYGNLQGTEYNDKYSDPIGWTYDKFDNLWRNDVRSKTPVDIRGARIGLHIELKDGNHISFDFNKAEIPEFTTAKAGETKPDKPVPAGREAVYRLYNPGLQPGAQHLYTASKTEYDDLIANHGWQGEDVQFYTTSDTKASPVYRVYNPYTS